MIGRRPNRGFSTPPSSLGLFCSLHPLVGPSTNPHPEPFFPYLIHHFFFKEFSLNTDRFALW